MNHLLYLSYGRGPHQQEVIFSALSAHHWSPAGEDYQIWIYTDETDTFKGLPFEIQFISTARWNDWAGPKQFNHRRKILALKHAIEHHAGPVVLLDGDTWLRAPVSRLFERVGPGRTLMHIREGDISRIDTPLFQRMRELLQSADLQDRNGNRFRIPTDVAMYNAGVIGIDSADAGLLDQVLDLTDQLCELSDLHVLEQFAFSYVLAQGTALGEADDLVFHYWPPYLHDPFRKELPQLMAESESLPLRQRVDHLYAHRPRPTWLRRGKVVAKRALQMAGVIRGRCRSNEW